MPTPFQTILEDLVVNTRGALGAALAAGDGEMVDFWTTWQNDDWALLTAHFGVVYQQIFNALRTFHFGDVQFLFLRLETVGVAIQAIDDGYFALLALKLPAQVQAAEINLRASARELLREMG